MNINDFLNKKGTEVKGSINMEGAKEVTVKAVGSIWEAAKYLTPANIKMVENLREEVELDRAHAVGNIKLVIDRVNEISDALGYDLIAAMSDEEALAFAEQVKAAQVAAKKAAKEEKKAAKAAEEEVKNEKLKAFFDGFKVPKKDPNPVEPSIQTPYPDEDAETALLRKIEEKLLRQEAPIIIEAEAVEVVEEEKPKPRRARAEKRRGKEKPAKEAAAPSTTKPSKKVSVFDEPDGKYNFEDMA